MVVERIDTGMASSRVKDFVGLDVLVRLLALIADDPKYQKDGISSIGSQLSILFRLIRDKDISPIAVSSLFLILESLLSISDEPKKVLPSDMVEALINEDAKQKGKSKPRKDDLPTETFVFSVDEKLNLLEDVIRYFKGHKLENDLHHALLRMIVRLTRHADISSKFLELGGLPLLFDSDRLVKFPAQQQLTLMIIRNLVEDTAILRRIFKNEIISWFSSYKPRAIDLNSYLKNFSHLAIRNSELFIEVSCSICCLSKFDISGRSQNLILKAVEEEESQTDDPISKDDKSLQSATVGNCGLVIKHIVASLLSIKSAKEQIGAELSGENRDLEHIQRCFYLQCLSELLVSYPECRREVISASSRRSSGKTPQKMSGRNHLLNHLLHDLIYKDLKYLDKEYAEIQDMKIRKKSAENFWSCSVLCGLCVNSDGVKSSNLLDPRKSTMDAIGKYLKDSSAHSSHSTEERYGIYIALSELLQRILSYRAPSPVAVFQRLSKSNDDHAIQNSKLMLEDGFVGLITSLIAELDEHHPLFNGLLAKMLKPLEILTKSAISLGQASSDSTEEVPEKHSPSDEVGTDQAVPLESEDNGELSNIYRNSSLSMFAPRSDDVEGLSPEEGYEEFSSDESMDDGDEAVRNS
jgi:E3 ubiquitin-protein ligase HUWE1